MNGAHDLGGMHGFGSIDQSQTEHFPNEWERKVFALTLASGFQGKWNLDQSRFARESMEPGEYLSSSYYEHWLHGLETLLLERDIVNERELKSGVAEKTKLADPVPASRVATILAKGGPTHVPSTQVAKFSIGDVVKIDNQHPSAHTRMPRYIRGRRGKVIGLHGAHIFPDTHAARGEKTPEFLYTISFTGEELWGHENKGEKNMICVDVFEPYILSAIDNSGEES